MASEARQAFLAAMDDDFNTATAIGSLFEFTRKINAHIHNGAVETADTWRTVDTLYNDLVGSVLGLVTEATYSSESAGLTDQLLRILVDTRADLRKARQFALADQIRDRLAAASVQLEDKPEGTSWRLTPPEPSE